MSHPFYRKAGLLAAAALRSDARSGGVGRALRCPARRQDRRQADEADAPSQSRSDVGEVFARIDASETAPRPKSKPKASGRHM
jgi:hypothetical protein